MTSEDANPTRARYRQVLAWRDAGLTHAEVGRRLGVSRARAMDLAKQARRWQERRLALPAPRRPSALLTTEMPLEALPISAQAKRSLWRAGFQTIGDVTLLSDAVLLGLRDIGPGTVATLREAVAAPDDVEGGSPYDWTRPPATP